MKIEIEVKDESIRELVRDVMQNQPEYSAGMALQCRKWDYDDCHYIFDDVEAGVGVEDSRLISYELDEAALVKGMELMLKGIATDELHFYGMDGLAAALNPCAWDADSVDALVQMACMGKVIYG